MLEDVISIGENKWSPTSSVDKGKAKMTASSSFSPHGLKVLVVDDSQVCLAVLKKMLQTCKYSVTTCTSATAALALVQGSGVPFDLVLCDVHMPGMDGFKLMQAIGLDLPVIMMSSDDETTSVMKGIAGGACDYFLKPVCLQRLQTIWQHVFRKREMGGECTRDGDASDADRAGGSRSLTDKDGCRKRKGKEEAMDDAAEFVNGSSKKKTRLVWTAALHKQFVDAVKNLGTANAVPKQILEKMNVKGISRENVASHLQKYRKYLIDQGAVYEDERVSISGMNIRHPNPTESFQAVGNFSGSIEIQTGTRSPLPYSISSLYPPQNMTPINFTSLNFTPLNLAPQPLPPQSLTNQSLGAQNLAAQNLDPRDMAPRDLAPRDLAPRDLAPRDLAHRDLAHRDLAPRDLATRDLAPRGVNPQDMPSDYGLNTELFPVPSRPFHALDAGHLRSAYNPELFPESVDAPSSSNIPQRFKQCQDLVDVYPFYNNTDYGD